ncbi:hypothetical protein K439DRAFT_1662792 [Ramaria rubella]|nr:hypothetical protein K439DRAFT_1662792 [Ramaria rubella]
MHPPNGDVDQQIVPGSIVIVDNDTKAKFDAIEYWQKRLASVTPTIFPLCSTPSPVVTSSSACQSFAISHENLTRDYGIELQTLITLAYALTLGAHSASSDEVVFGYIYREQNIDTPYVEDRIHPRSITLPYNIAFNWDQITLDFLRDLQTDIAEIDDHPRVALREIPISSAAPLFRTILSCFPLSASEDKFYAQDSLTDGVNYNFAFFVRTIGSEDIHIETRFTPASISGPEIKVFQDHFGTALYSILQNLTSPLRNINLVSPEEKRCLIVANNPVYPLESSLNPVNNVTELIERQASRTPQRIALQFGQEMFVTYREMDMFANSLAHTLIANGVKRGDLVGIYMDKSCEMFMSILAIHKSGGGYIPLDPTHPAERIQTILSFAAVRVVLTSDELCKQFDSLILTGGPFSLAVDIHKLTLASKPNAVVDRDDICHVLFTSGSTGTPKGGQPIHGVVLTHGSIIESLIGAHAVIGHRDDRVLQFSNYTFDVSVWDWSITLSDGGTLCIVPRRELMDNLGAVADCMDITFLETTPTVLALVKPEEVPSLLKLVVSGELLTSEVRNTWANVVSLVNAYGPTETSTNVLARTNVTSSIEGSNIGWPFGLNAVYILDERMRPVPLGCVGELFVSGPQVARGYLNNPEQTAKAFMDDPFRPGSIMYATGDFVRMSPVDGSFSYLGRRDTQIKIRGLRVEIGEIETVLKAASDLITNAVVLKIHVGHDTLVAFLEHPSDLHSAGAEPTIIRNETVRSILAVLRSTVRKKLPSYMVPGNYIVLDKFPLTSSGKLDRKALDNFFYKNEQGIREHRADPELLTGLYPPKSVATPETDHQVMLRSLWALILNLNEDSLSIDDNFYAVGGDSISAIRLASLAREASLPLLATDIIENPTIRTMAHITESSIVNRDFDEDDVPSVSLDQMAPNDLTLMDLDQQRLDALRGELLPDHGLLSSDVLDIFPCTALQTSFLLAGLLVDNAYIVRQVYDLPFGTTSARIQQAFGDFINHPNGAFLRTVFVFDPLSNRFLQAVMRPTWKQMEWLTITVADEVELDIVIAKYQEGRGALKFERAELLTRACIFELNGIPRALAWSSHHALADHWTLNNAERDIGDIYSGRSLQSRRSFKPMLKYLERLDRTAGLDFWRRHLLNASPTAFLEALPGAPRATVDKNISRKIYADHKSLTQQFGITASSLITAAWAIVLAAHAGNMDVVFGQVVAGRNAPIKDIDSLMGNTINTVPRRVVLKPEASVLDTLRKIQLEQNDVSRHEHTALADLIAEEIPVSSLFRTLLNFVNLPGDQKQGTSGEEDPCKQVLWNRKVGTLDGEDLPFSLTVTPWATEGFVIGVNYTTAVVSDEEVIAILDHVEAAIQYLLHHHNAPICDVELVDERELKRMMPVAKLGDQLSLAQNISELIEMQVLRTPQRIALQFDQETFLTYAEMDGLANDLAGKLVDGGVQRGTLIALYMDKSIEMFLSILAVHKAGGGYVPLDIDHPAERIQTIIRLAQTTMVLTTRELHNRLASTILDATVTAVSVDLRDLFPATRPDVGPIGRDDVCHVLFTSGSTGTPKGTIVSFIGVVLTHGSIIESAIGSQEVMGPLNGRVLQFSNYTFDVSVWDWSATLIAGGTLCIARKHRLMDDLGEVSRDMDVTFIETTPTVLSLIRPEEVPSVQMLAVGGEVLTANVRDTWADTVLVINVYGPTEASTNVLALRDVTSSTECSKIGYVFGLNAVYNLDERLRPVPLGCVGELFVGGPQVARGYLGMAEETAKAFVADPFRPGSTMYATGDLVRMNPGDGSLSFVDRRDTQIKIRGLRVETGEIEAVLKATSTAITNAVVLKVDVGHETLVAFLEYGSQVSEVNTDVLTIVNDKGFGELVASLRYAIRQKLPRYMAPTIYVTLTRFPVTSTGKLDRKALNAYFHRHQHTLMETGANSDSHQNVDTVLLTEMQLAVRSLWASILGIGEGPLRIDDDFYTVGGDSMSAIRLASAARKAGLRLSATDIIRNSTIGAMAQTAEFALVDHSFDDDEAPSVTLDGMVAEDLTVLPVDRTQLDFLRMKLLPAHGLSASDALDVYPATGLQTSLLMAGLMVRDAYIVRQAWNLPLGTNGDRLQQAFEDFIDHPNGMMFRTVFAFDPTSNRWLQPDVGPVGRHDVCHVLFTSGTTGTPKGVILTHGSIIESAIGSQEVIGPLNGRVLQFSNYTFDFSVWDWSATLIAGGTLCIVRKQTLMDDLGAVNRDMDVTFLETTPTVISLIHPWDVPSLQILVASGEVLTPNVRDTWADIVSLKNVYGPTEAATSVTGLKNVTASTECSKIGHGFGLNSLYNLDELLRPVPLGCVGELFISGPQVASGYLQNPEETAKAFVADPFHPGSTMYATGDLVRMNPEDGSLSFVDRRDTQIKIRGLRVETGEIEAVLKATSTAITNAVVLKVDVGHETLVAFLHYGSDASTEDVTIVDDEGLSAIVASLRHSLRQKLPSYMAPNIYVTLNRFPVTSTGKLDRKTLTAYFYTHQPTIMATSARAGNGDLADHGADPALLTKMQLAVRSLWATTLRVTEVSLRIDDDFYTAGGDSMSAIRLASAARGAGLHLPATDIIRHPTIRAMAEIAESAIVNHEFDDDEAPSVTLDQMRPEDLTLLTMDQAHLDLLRVKLLPDHGFSASDVLDVYPVTGLQTSLLMAGLMVEDAYIVRQAWNLPLGMNGGTLQEAFEEFIDHPNGMMFRTVFAFDPTLNRWLQILMRPGARRMEWTTVVVSDEAELELRVADYEGGHAIQPFEKGDIPARACVFELDGSVRVLVWCMHHALLDHWALDNAILDIENAYAHRPFAPRRSFKAMIKYLECLNRTPGLDFWRTHLANVAPTPFLQTLPGASRATTNATVGRELRMGHGSFTRESGIMPSTLVTAAWSLVLAAHSNSSDVVFGQVLAGRSAPAIEPFFRMLTFVLDAPIKDVWSMTGITINTVPRRVIRKPEITVLDMLRQIQSDQIEISKHENITLAELQSEGIAPSGLFKSILNFRNFPVNELAHPRTDDGGPIFANFRHGSRDGYAFAPTFSGRVVDRGTI